MKIVKENCDCSGIYVIKNLVNGKIYVGKSKNCYKRLHQHLSDIKIDSRNYNENPHLLNAFKKYGSDNFGYYIVERFNEENEEILENLLKERELYWMKELDSLNREKGYNLRYDSEGKCFCSSETSEKISNRLKKEWESGIRDGHSEKMKDYWNNNEERKEQQRKIMSKNKTKYLYTIYNPEGELITTQGDYNLLKSLKIDSVKSNFRRKNSDDVTCKGYRIIRRNIEDIVHPFKKLED